MFLGIDLAHCQEVHAGILLQASPQDLSSWLPPSEDHEAVVRALIRIK
jgi:hypothetical protein